MDEGLVERVFDGCWLEMRKKYCSCWRYDREIIKL